MALSAPPQFNWSSTKADPTLAEMSFKAHDAATPADMSNLFARMADSYDRTMRGQAKMWGAVIKSVQPFVNEAAANYGESQRYKTMAGSSRYKNAEGFSPFLDSKEYQIKNPDFDASTVDGGFLEKEQPGVLAPQKPEYRKPGKRLFQEEDEDIPTFKEWVLQDPKSRRGADAKQKYEEEFPSSKSEPQVKAPTEMRIDTNGNPEFITKRTLGLNDISKGLRKTYDPRTGTLEERKRKRMELQIRKKQIYADIDLLETGFDDIAKKIGSNNYYKDAMYTDSGGLRLLNAIGTMHNPTGKTKDGDYAQAGYDAENRLVLRLFDKNGDPVLKNKKNRDSEQISIKVNEMGSLLTPKLTGKEKKAFSNLWQNFIKTGATRGANLIETGDGFANNFRDMVNNKETLHQVMHEKHFLNFQTSFIDDMMATNGKGSKLSATLFQALADTNGATDGQVNLPTNSDGKPIDIDTRGGNHPGFDVMDFAGDGVGLQNYAKIASAVTNRNSEYYNEDVTREMVIHWAKEKGMEKALIAQGKIPPIDHFGKRGADKNNTESSRTLNDIIKSAKGGDFSTLLLPKKKQYGDRGVIKWNPNGKNPGTDIPGYFQIEQDGKIKPLTGQNDIRTNFGLRKLMMNYGVSNMHYNQYAKAGMFKSPLFNMNKFKQIQTNFNAINPLRPNMGPMGMQESKPFQYSKSQKQQSAPKGKRNVDDWMKEFGIE